MWRICIYADKEEVDRTFVGTFALINTSLNAVKFTGFPAISSTPRPFSVRYNIDRDSRKNHTKLSIRRIIE